MRILLAAAGIVLALSPATRAEAQSQAPQTQVPHVQTKTLRRSSVYVLEGVTFTQMQGQLATLGSDYLQVQFGVGYQPTNSLWAYELLGKGGGALSIDAASLVGWGLRAKRFLYLNSALNLYGRVGLTENFLMDRVGSDLAGFGIEYGVGAMASARVRALGFLFFPAFFLDLGPKVDVSLWVDIGGELGNLHGGHESSAESYNYRSTTASYGLSVGGRF